MFFSDFNWKEAQVVSLSGMHGFPYKDTMYLILVLYSIVNQMDFFFSTKNILCFIDQDFMKIFNSILYNL